MGQVPRSLETKRFDLTSRQKVRDRAQRLLFEYQKRAFPREPVPLLFRPKYTRRQNCEVMIPSPGMRCGNLVLNDVVEVEVKYGQEVLDGKWGCDWALGYAMTVHSSQGLTICNPQKVWIIDDYLQWSNLTYLAVSRVEYMHQLEQVVCPPEEGSEDKGPISEQHLRNVIARKLAGH